MIRRPPRSTLFPYTTLFRSVPGVTTEELDRLCHDHIVNVQRSVPANLNYRGFPKTIRSEEHTSELQSQSNLVCRLLLEQKKKTNERAFLIYMTAMLLQLDTR